MSDIDAALTALATELRVGEPGADLVAAVMERVLGAFLLLACLTATPVRTIRSSCARWPAVSSSTLAGSASSTTIRQASGRDPVVAAVRAARDAYSPASTLSLTRQMCSTIWSSIGPIPPGPTKVIPSGANAASVPPRFAGS